MIIADAHLHFDLLTEDEQAEISARPHHFALSAGVWPQDTGIALRSTKTPLPQVFWAAGLHPAFVPMRFTTPEDKEEAEASLMTLAREDRIRAIGETGFDLSRDPLQEATARGLGKERLLSLQQEAFALCLSVARMHAKPLVLHSREAWAATLAAVETARREAPDLPLMIHCFPGAAAEVPRLARLGTYLSFGGVLTWPTAKKMKDALLACPRDRLLLETDAPDLPPVLPGGERPRRNSPSNWTLVLHEAAKILGLDPGELAAIAKTNFERFLGQPLRTSQ